MQSPILFVRRVLSLQSQLPDEDAQFSTDHLSDTTSSTTDPPPYIEIYSTLEPKGTSPLKNQTVYQVNGKGMLVYKD